MRDLLFFSGYALYLVFSYVVFHSATLLSSGGELSHTSQTLFVLSVLAARVLMYGIIAAVIRYIKELSTAVFALLAGGVVIAGFIVTEMVFQFSGMVSGESVLPWLLLGGALLGAGDALITLMWARFSATLTLRSVYLYVLVCNVLSLLVYWVVTLLPIAWAAPAAALLFIVSVGCAKKALDIRSSSWEYSLPVFKGALRRIAHPIVGTSILCFMAGLMLQISGQQEIPLSSFQQVSLITSAIVIVCLLLPALLIKKPLNVGRMYALALPLSAAGFLLLPLIWNAAGGIVNSFAQTGSMVASIILWCMLADISRDTELPSGLLFSLAFICTNVAQFAGVFVGYLNADTLKQGDLVLTTVALVAVYLLFMVALFLFKDKSLKGEGEPPRQEIPTEEILVDRCAFIAEEHRFTPRETEIFRLLAQGFTIPVISEKLFVSENTVKSHVKSIYQKLDIHTRSELIERVNTQ